ncbi:MAG: heterodisulfide reductase-related iron-sulfur binding cluster [Candidatus Acidiferrales bacterium]
MASHTHQPDPAQASTPQSQDDAQREFQLTLSGFTAIDKPEYDDYSRCVHCGLCANDCPTYRLWGQEADSPRGRIRQMALVDQGRLELGESFVTHIDRCLNCRNCETVCPSGVEYGKILELARAQIEQKYKRPFVSRVLRDLVYRRLLPYPGRIAVAARALKFYQHSGLASLARATGILRLLGLQNREQLLPAIDSKFFFSELGKAFPARGERRARVAFFAGCVAQVTFSALNRATIRVLQANGCEVVVPAKQVCCGALAAHAGVRDVARDLARRNFDAFLSDDFDAILTNAAGCGSTLKEYAHLFADDEAGRGRAEQFSAKMRDVIEYLAELGLTAPLRALPLRVTYQDSCHLVHGQKIREAPRQLLRAMPGIEFVEMPMSEQCCGSAGVYNVTETKASLEILERKMEAVQQTKAEVVATANPGCILQLRAGAAMHRTGQEVLHLIELLDRAQS